MYWQGPPDLRRWEPPVQGKLRKSTLGVPAPHMQTRCPTSHFGWHGRSSKCDLLRPGVLVSPLTWARQGSDLRPTDYESAELPPSARQTEGTPSRRWRPSPGASWTSLASMAVEQGVHILGCRSVGCRHPSGVVVQGRRVL